MLEGRLVPVPGELDETSDVVNVGGQRVSL
jgi:hypothetical protein